MDTGTRPSSTPSSGTLSIESPEFLGRLTMARAMADVANCGCGTCNRFEAVVLRDIVLHHDWATEAAIDEGALPADTRLSCACTVHPNPLWERRGSSELHMAPEGWHTPRLELDHEGPSEYYSAIYHVLKDEPQA